MRAVLILAGLLLVGRARAQPVGPRCVWQPLMGTMADFRDRCKTKPVPDVRACLLDFMKGAGAAPEAVAFARRLDGEGYLYDYERSGAVGVASVHYPFRANSNDGVLLVARGGGLIDVSDVERLRPLMKDRRLASVLKGNPRATLWASDPGRPRVEERAGGRDFLFEFPLRLCHACADLAVARVAYGFDGAGRFQGVRLLSVSRPK